MFQTIDIKAYRGLKNITLQNLSRVNILVGENNTGKTSILEAIQLLRDPEVVDNVLSIAKKRQPRNIMVQSANLIPFDEFLYSFPVQGEQKDIVIYATDYELKKWHIELCGTIKKEIYDKEDLSESEQRRYDLYCGEDGEISVISGNFLYISENLTSENSYSFRETQLRPDMSMKETLDIKKEKVINSSSFSARGHSEVFEPKPSQAQYTQDQTESQAQIRSSTLSDRDVLRIAAQMAKNSESMLDIKKNHPASSLFRAYNSVPAASAEWLYWQYNLCWAECQHQGRAFFLRGAGRGRAVLYPGDCREGYAGA